MTRPPTRPLRQLRDRLGQPEQLFLVLVAVVIGLLGGLAAVGFRRLIVFINRIAWHDGQYTVAYLVDLPWWWKVLAPALGGLVVGLIIHLFAREAKGHGVPEVMEAVALRGGRIRPRVLLAKLFASGVCIGSGGSVGREGPIVQIGSALGSSIGQWLKVDPERLRTLVGCGAAAGIAATFNAPIAGALFAVEIILGDFGVAQFSPVVISSVTGTVVSQSILGDVPAFQVPSYSLVHASELLAYAALGILAGLAALAFIRALYGTEDLFDGIRLPAAAKPLLGGLLIGGIGIWAPQIFGVGYESIEQALNGTIVWQFMLVLVVAKIVAVALTIGSGGSGGVFAPSLFIGAMLGGAVGTVISNVWPTITAGTGAYALVGMGATVAAATHAPLTAILIIFELTADYKIILPLMISCIIATLLATRLDRASIYTRKLLRRGIDVRRGKAVNVLEPVRVAEVMRPDAATVKADDGLVKLVSRFISHPGSTLFVTDGDQQLLGIVTADQLRPAMADARTLDSLVIAADVMTDEGYPEAAPGDSLAGVMQYMGTYRGEVPVTDGGRLIGVIWPEDVIERYNTEVFKRDMARSMANAVGREEKLPIPAAGDAVVAEMHVPYRFVGRTMRELKVRETYRVSVLMIKQTTPDGVEELVTAPDADYRFRANDTLLVLGTEEDIERCRRGNPRRDTEDRTPSAADAASGPPRP